MPWSHLPAPVAVTIGVAIGLGTALVDGTVDPMSFLDGVAVGFTIGATVGTVALHTAIQLLNPGRPILPLTRAVSALWTRRSSG